ncbi:MAG: ankyrin repeat domain-containing protein [Alphaproteobacteria bacterium]
MFKKNKIAAKDIFDLIDNGHLDDVRNWHKDNPEALNIIGTDYKCTPLIWAAWHGKNEILDYLIASGVDLDAQDKDHDTALSSAAKKGRTYCLQRLILAGADTSIKTSHGKTAKEHAPESCRMIFDLENNGRFIKESAYIVSICDYAEASQLSIKKVFNFKAREIITITHDMSGQINSREDFKQQYQLKQAAEFLKKENGDLCGYKIPAII